MKPIQINMDKEMIHEIDRHLGGAKRGRGEFVRQAVLKELKRLRIRELEEQERLAYEKKPVKPGEFVFYRRRDWPE